MKVRFTLFIFFFYILFASIDCLKLKNVSKDPLLTLSILTKSHVDKERNKKAGVKNQGKKKYIRYLSPSKRVNLKLKTEQHMKEKKKLKAIQKKKQEQEKCNQNTNLKTTNNNTISENSHN